MVALTFPDGARREYQDGISGFDIAKGISPSLAKRTMAMAIDGEVRDLSEEIRSDGKVEFLNRDDPRALELQKRTNTLDWPRRDPGLLVDLILSAVT